MPRFVADITINHVFEARDLVAATAMAEEQLAESLASSWLSPNPTTWVSVEDRD